MRARPTIRSGPLRRLLGRAALLAGVAASAAGTSLAAQERGAQLPPDTAAPEPPASPSLSPGGWAAWAAVPHTWSTVAAVTVALPSGSEADPEGRSGTAWLLGETVLHEVRERLGPSVVSAEARISRGRFLLQVLTVPEAWTRAYRALEELLFAEGALRSSSVSEVRARRQAALVFEAGSPARTFELELHEMLGGPEAPWSRPPRGTPASLDAVAPEDLTAWREREMVRGRAVVAVTGAVDAAEVARVLTGEAPPALAAEPPLVAVGREPPPDGAAPWTEGTRIRRVREVTSGWIGAAWPLEPGTPETALELLLHRIRDELVTDPPPPGLFSADVEVETLPGGGRALVVRTAVLPEAMEEWEARVVETVTGVAGTTLEPGFFRWHRRRFRAHRLLEDAAPEAEGRRVALDLLRSGSVRDLPAEIWQLAPGALSGAGSALGEPRILVWGPDLSASPDR